MTSLTAVARRLAFVRETEGANRGAWVQAFQRFTGGRPGDSWCADFLSFVLDVAYHGKSPVPRSGSCAVLLAAARTVGTVQGQPSPDDLFFYVTAAGHAHHVGIVTAVRATGQDGIAGNTSEDGASDNGTGVFEHAISSDPATVVFVRLPLEGA